ncbi:MAG TPA: class I SAM-dependent methyltransferase [Paenibacillaceae bacterium]|nr:class I SAM-dependent methyltransferase [Paenibacillaceae bacterium]
MNGQCKICGSKTREFYYKTFDLNYYQCNECDFISRDGNSIISSEEEVAIYNEHENSIEDPRYVAYFKKFIDEAVVNYSGQGKKGLDFGSGPSPVLATVLERDYNYSMDIYDVYYAPEKTYIGQKYDLVTCTEVVEHLSNPLEYFHLFKELLKEDGILCIMTSFHPKDEERFLKWHYVRDLTHVSFFTLKTMKIIGEKLGLDIIYSDHHRYTTFKRLNSGLTG